MVVNPPFLVGDILVDNSSRAFLDNIAVRCDLTGDDCFAESIARLDDELIAIFRHRMHGKRDARNL